MRTSPGNERKEKHVGFSVTRSEALGQQVQDEQEREAVAGATLKADPELASSNLELKEVEVGGSVERCSPPGKLRRRGGRPVEPTGRER